MTTLESGPGRARLAVTVVTPGFPPERGGVEAHTAALVQHVHRRGIDVEVLTARRGQRRRTVRSWHGVRVVTYPAWPVRALSISPRLVMAAIRRRLSGRLIHVHSYHATTALAVLGPSARTVFTPHYHGTHGHTPIADVLHRGFYRLAKRALPRCDAVICVSDAERRQLVADFPALADGTVVIPNGVEVEVIRCADPLGDVAQTVCYVGRLEAYKGVTAVVRAFADVPAPAQLVIIGDGTQRQHLVDLVAELGLDDRVVLTGALPDAELHRWLRTAKVFISMSRREAFGMAPLEAAAAGARIILSDIPAHREIATGYLGEQAVLVPDVGPSDLAAQIIIQLEKARVHAQRLPDWPQVAARTVEVYESVSHTVMHHRSAFTPE